MRYEVYKYRWVVLLTFCLIKYSSCATYGLFVPFSSYLTQIYGIHHVFIVLSSYSFNGLYPIASFFIADPIIHACGVRVAVRLDYNLQLGIAIIGMLICLWLRTLLNEWIYLINVGSFVAALTDPLQCNIVSLVATNWFPTQQQVTALTVISIFSILGPVGGSFYSLIFIDPAVRNISDAKEMMFYATLYLAMTYTGVYAVSMLAFRGKPEVPPWYVEEMYKCVVRPLWCPMRSLRSRSRPSC